MGHSYVYMECGAVIIILFAQFFDKNNFTLFLGGYVIGSITEYMTSFLVEMIVGTRWWDYSKNILNVNGRICLLYSIFWGVLTVIFIRKINPIIDKLIDKIKEKISVKVLKGIVLAIIIFLFLDCMATAVAQRVFLAKMAFLNNIKVENEAETVEIYEQTKNSKFINKYWNDEKMLKTFPNIKLEDKDGNMVYIDSLLPEIQTYYYKFF